MRAGVLLPSFARAISPSVETITVVSVRRAQPVHHHDRLRCRAAVGLQPLRNQKPAAIQCRMLRRRNYRAFNPRQKHG